MRSQIVRMDGGHVAGLEWCGSPVVDRDPVRRGTSCRLKAAKEDARTDHVSRVRCRFAGEVSRVEFGEGGVDVIGIEEDARHDPFA